MILFPDDIQAMNELLAKRSGLDPELLEACQGHIGHGQYADAVLKAFIVLEGRIQRHSGIRTKKGAGDLIGRALASTPEDVPGKRGPLTQKLGLEHEQAVNLMTLLRGAFAVFRNPEGHAGLEPIVEYGSAECQAVLAFVNLMLKALDRKPDAPLEAFLKQVHPAMGPEGTANLRHFLTQAMKLNLDFLPRDKSIPFRAPAWRVTSKDAPPKNAPTVVFSLEPRDGKPRLVFPSLGHWAQIPGFDYTGFADRLKSVGCTRGPGQYVFFDLQEQNSAVAFDRLYAVVRDVVQAMEATVAAQQGKAQ